MSDLAAKTDTEWDSLIENHRAKGATGAPLYLAALEERERRKGQGFDFEKTKSVLIAAATNGKVITYKDLADASGLDWSKVHWSVTPHLERMLEFCHRNGWPLLSAIVVSKEQAAGDGRLRDDNLKGFISGCERIGIAVDANHMAFADMQQDRVFAWAKEQISS
ncbi:hypothetical protein [Elioraea rosea]|uniref:hypothetical protein n=1 Tax=Elioraea rosea TaxID=2492390 RepID=UPI001183B68E|nr:hypothetical protein [Elioraea rosea]